jgi:hypothetical protein
MNEESVLIVKAIESLQQEANPLKDYLFPLIAAFFSSLLGAFVAYFTISHQDKIKLEKDRVHIINDWVLLAEGAMQSLISIKQNYHGKLSNNPFQRALVTRAFIHSTKKIDKNISELSFIIPKKDDTESIKEKWRQLPRIRAIIENYNFIIELWNKRSKDGRPLIEKILKDHSNLAHAHVTQEQIFESVSPADFIVLIDLTEKAINFTDDFIIELNDFIAEFPKVGKSIINSKAIEKHGPIICYKTEDNPILLGLIEKEPEVDFAALAILFGLSIEDVKQEFTTGYEQ